MFIFKLVAAVFALPWTIAFALVRFIVACLRLPWQLQAKTADVIYCASGHPNGVMGRWTCSCGAVYLGHAFAPCPVCNMPAGWVNCEVCGLSLRSPWKSDS